MEPNVRNAAFATVPNTVRRNQEQNGHWTVKQDETGSDARRKEQVASRHEDLKSDGGWKRRDVSGGRSGRVERSVNGQPELWTPPEDRGPGLAVVKSGPLYDIWAYRGEKKPSRLYGGEDEDGSPYRILPEGLSPEEAQALEAERQEVIKSQTVRKSTTVAERRSSGPTYTAVFATCFNGHSPDQDARNVDTEQISFAAAREQFLALEKSDPNVLLGTEERYEPPRRTQTMPGIGLRAPTDLPQRGWDDERDLPTPRGHGPLSDDRVGLVETRPGLKVVIIDERMSRRNVRNPPHPPDDVDAPEETPIEREIRLSLEREEDLWKERGIPRTGSRDELVEIRTRPLLWSPSPEGKEKPRLSFPVRREIEQEAKREEGLQKEGRPPGTYSRGGRRELAQRRKVFEPGVAPSPCRAMISEGPGQPDRATLDGEGVTWTSEARDNGGEPPLLASSHRPIASSRPSPDPGGPGEEGLVMEKAHFAVPVRKLRFSFAGGTKVEEGEASGPAAPPRREAFTLQTWRPRTSALIDQEIREALQREMELQEERRRRRRSATAGPRPPNTARTGSPGCTSPALSPSLPGRASALASPDGFHPFSESGFQTCLSPSMRRREKGKYAGLGLGDEIDTEVVRSTKAICRRGVLAQLWEAGQIRNAGRDDEDEDESERGTEPGVP